ncbi:MAG: hypothetical protein NT068_01580 [Candidatus Nomurabacteria bacterium]|nr:hypothetical protein [Candidatus Nomurabacteria bacterium]
MENLFVSWREFLNGKRKRQDVILFGVNLMDNIYSLHNDLKNKTYKHSNYEAFKINDPKPRDIHKAIVRDRLLHHAIYRILYPYFDKKFIHDSYSCRIGKGTHKAIYRFESFIRKVSNVEDKDTLKLLSEIIDSFETNISLSAIAKTEIKGLPLGKFN